MKLDLIGCDPEVFGVDDGGRPISLIGFIGGTKQKPVPVRNGTLQEDNVMAEIGIIPAQTEDEFVARILDVQKQLQAMLDPHKIRIAVQAMMRFPPSVLRKKQARTVGCDPDMSAWTGDWNDIVDLHPTERYGAGHIHMGWENPTMEQRINLVKFCDLYIGLPQVLMTDATDRRLSYGRAGNFRPKDYGAEYRTPSNFWLADVHLMRWIFKQAHKAAQASEQEFEMVVSDGRRVREAIDTHDKGLAAALVDKYGISFI